MVLLPALTLLLALASPPVNETQALLAGLQAVDARVAAIGHRLAVEGAGLCPETTARAGFLVHSRDQYEPEVRADAAQLFGLGGAPAILTVVPGSAAARAGLLAGDSIVAIDGGAPPAGSDDGATYERVAATEAMIESALADGVLRLTVERDGRRHEIEMAGDRGCATRFQVEPGRSLDASADGSYVKLSTALVDFAGSDDALALVIAHELSHNILRHRETLDAQGVERGFFRIFGKNPGRIRATENEADRLALHLMARAGFDIRVAPAFWDRFGRETGHGILADGTHAGRRERIAIAEAEIARIAAQRARGEPPTPAFDPAAPPSADR